MNESKAPLRPSYQVSYFPPLRHIVLLPSIHPMPPIPPIPLLPTMLVIMDQFNNRCNKAHLNGVGSNPGQNVNVNQFAPNHLNNPVNHRFPQLDASYSSTDLPSYEQAMSMQPKRRNSLVYNFN